MRAVNLLPRDAERERRTAERRLPALVAAATGAVVFAVLAGGYLMQSAKVGDAQRALDAANAQLAATPVPPAVKAQPTAAAADAQRQPRLQAVSLALSQRIAWDRILREFSLVLPNDVWLGSLSLSAPSAAVPGIAAAPGTGLQLTGTTYSYDSVARLISRLALIPDLSGVTLGNSSRTKNLVTFGVNAGVKGAPAPPAAPVPPPTTSTDTTSGASS
jgi:Tfp pilus assembly protein PilN